MYKGEFKLSMQQAIRSFSAENPNYTFMDSMKWDEKFRIPGDIFDHEYRGSLSFLDWFLSVWPDFSSRYNPESYGDYYTEEIRLLDGVYSAAMKARENIDIWQCAEAAEDLFEIFGKATERNVEEAQEGLTNLSLEFSVSHTRILQMLAIRHLEAPLRQLAGAIQWE